MDVPVQVHTTAGALKEATAEAHANLETTMLPLLTSVCTKEDYVFILRLFYGYFQPLEAAIDPVITPALVPDLSERRKSDLLIEDLRNFGYTGAIRCCTDLPLLETPAQALGAMYVMEGSTLGGRGIVKMLLKNAPHLFPPGLRFFSGYEAHTGAMWQAFTGYLNGVTDPAAVLQMKEAANASFIKFQKWIEQELQTAR